jgi:hypothetical protein
MRTNLQTRTASGSRRVKPPQDSTSHIIRSVDSSKKAFFSPNKLFPTLPIESARPICIANASLGRWRVKVARVGDFGKSDFSVFRHLTMRCTMSAPLPHRVRPVPCHPPHSFYLGSAIYHQLYTHGSRAWLTNRLRPTSQPRVVANGTAGLRRHGDESSRNESIHILMRDLTATGILFDRTCKIQLPAIGGSASKMEVRHALLLRDRRRRDAAEKFALEDFAWHRPTQQIALVIVALQSTEKTQLRSRLNAFGHYF